LAERRLEDRVEDLLDVPPMTSATSIGSPATCSQYSFTAGSAIARETRSFRRSPSRHFISLV
jgi:hypothetical protein